MQRDWIPISYFRAAVAVTIFAWFQLASLVIAEDTNWRNRALDLNNITGDSAIRGEIKSLVEDPETAKKLLGAALPIAKEKEQPFNYNAAYILGAAALDVKNAEASEVFYKICQQTALKLHSAQRLVRSYLLLMGTADLFNHEKKFEQSAKLYQSFLETLEKNSLGGRLKEDVLRRMIQTLAQQGKIDEATKLTNNLLKLRSGDWRNLELKAWVHREAGQLDEAVKTYEDVLTKIKADKSLDKSEKSELSNVVHYILSGVYVDLNQIDKAAEQLKTLLADRPNDPTYNNDLGYIWADHGINLPEAEKLIRKALEEDRKQRQKTSEAARTDKEKDNAAFLDSLGWVLYKQKKYQEAKPILEKAVQDKEGQHIEIYDHLGDVLKALGDEAAATVIWQKALKAAGTGKREQERKAQVEKKLKEGQ